MRQIRGICKERKDKFDRKRNPLVGTERMSHLCRRSARGLFQRMRSESHVARRIRGKEPGSINVNKSNPEFQPIKRGGETGEFTGIVEALLQE